MKSRKYKTKSTYNIQIKNEKDNQCTSKHNFCL